MGIKENFVRGAATAGLAVGIAGCERKPITEYPTPTPVSDIEKGIDGLSISPSELRSLSESGHVVPADEIVSALEEAGIGVPFSMIDVPENFDPDRTVVFIDAEREKHGSHGFAIRLFHKTVEAGPEVKSVPLGDAVIMVIVNPIGIEAEPGSGFQSSGFYKIEAMLQGIPLDVYVCEYNGCLFAFGEDVLVRVDAATSGTDLFPVARGIGLVIDEETKQPIQSSTPQPPVPLVP